MSQPFLWEAGTRIIQALPTVAVDGASQATGEIIMDQKCAGTETGILFQLLLRKCRT